MKYALVTGARQGLGRGFVEHLSESGFTVFAGLHCANTSTDIANVKSIALDVTDDASIRDAYEKILAVTKRIDLVVNNAAVNKDTATNGRKEKVSSIGFLERDMLCEMFNINAVSPLMVTQTFLPLLTGTPSFVINISSCRASFHDEEDEGVANYGYCASKVALNMYTHRLVKELPSHVKTFAVHPGNVLSKMNPEGSELPRDQAAKIYAITENWTESKNGSFLRTDGSLYPL